MRARLRDWWDRKFFRIAVYVGFGMLSFLFFLLMTFPAHRISEIAGNQIEAALDHRYDVTVADVGFWRLTGVRADGVQLDERIVDGDQGPDQIGGGWNVHIERIGMRFSPLRSVLNRAPTVLFHVDTGGGIIDGTLVNAGADQEINLSVNRLDLQQSTLIDSLLGVRVLGTLEGDLDMVIDGQAGIVKSGRIDMTGRQLTLGETVLDVEGMVPFLTQLQLPTTNFGNVDIGVDIEETERGSRVSFQQFDIRGRDIQGEVWGDIELSPTGGRPRVELRLALDENYVTEHELDRILTIGEIREAQHEGWYGFVISGRLEDPNFQGSQTAAQGPQPADGEPEAEAGDDTEE